MAVVTKDEIYYRVSEAAVAAGMAHPSLAQWIKKGIVPAAKHKVASYTALFYTQKEFNEVVGMAKRIDKSRSEVKKFLTKSN